MACGSTPHTRSCWFPDRVFQSVVKGGRYFLHERVQRRVGALPVTPDIPCLVFFGEAGLRAEPWDTGAVKVALPPRLLGGSERKRQEYWVRPDARSCRVFPD